VHTAVHQRDTADYNGPGKDKQIGQEGYGKDRVAAKAFQDAKSTRLNDVICDEEVGIG